MLYRVLKLHFIRLTL